MGTQVIHAKNGIHSSTHVATAGPIHPWIGLCIFSFVRNFRIHRFMWQRKWKLWNKTCCLWSARKLSEFTQLSLLLEKYARCASSLNVSYKIEILTTNPSASVLHVHRLLWPRSYHWYHHLSLIQSRWQLHHKSQLSDSSQREDWTLHCRSICCYYYCPTRTTSAHPRRCDFNRRCRFVFQNPRPMLSAGEEEWDRGCWKCSTTSSNY